jgi:hypothetical protein
MASGGMRPYRRLGQPTEKAAFVRKCSDSYWSTNHELTQTRGLSRRNDGPACRERMIDPAGSASTAGEFGSGL